jgi:RNA polymerase sigma-70 factor, ECF subfamily
MEDLKIEFSSLYDDNVEKIYRFSLLKVGSKEVAEEITSETFLKAWKFFKKQGTTERINNTQAFLYKLARNLIIDHYRKAGKNKTISMNDFELADSNNIHESAEIKSDFDNARAILATMREDYQQVIICRHIEGMAIPEISKMMNKSEGATRAILHRALTELKSKFGEIDEA